MNGSLLEPSCLAQLASRLFVEGGSRVLRDGAPSPTESLSQGSQCPAFIPNNLFPSAALPMCKEASVEAWRDLSSAA